MSKSNLLTHVMNNIHPDLLFKLSVQVPLPYRPQTLTFTIQSICCHFIKYGG